ncbi:MAG TPA: hypothetical protein D7I00_04635 [Candidatus Poseidoniales archaeon]|nr:MAG TPA: hypothetical protein D7I00_04635 [Candidatus Poseidoniales archaeon]
MLLIALMVFQTASLLVLDSAEAASGRGGPNDDFRVTKITLGNLSDPANEWVQSDQSVVDYLVMGQEIEITVEVQRLGNQFTGRTAMGMIEIVHPIGYVIESYNWTTAELVGQQKGEGSYVWMPMIAHSILNTTTNDLTGGLIVRASVLYSGDNLNENDVLEQSVPVAIMKDKFDGTTLAIDTPTFVSGRYPSGGGDATGGGSWQEDTGGPEGTDHWRHSAPGADYPSGAHDRLVNAFFSQTQQCGAQGQLDPGLSQAYQIYICRNIFFAGEFISTQFYAQTWGSLAAGDNVAFELWRGSGNYNNKMESLVWNFSNGAPSPASGQWTNISWDPQTDWAQIPGLTNPDLFLGGNSYSIGLLFHSDNSGASEGMHVDDFIQFGVSKVADYTLDVDCDNPEAGFSSPPSNTIALHCLVTNNGYSGATVSVYSNVTNLTWMDPAFPSIRIETSNPNDFFSPVIIPSIGAGQTVDVYVNISIPAGAEVQQQTWQVWFRDSGGTNSGEKGRVSMNLAVTEQFGVSLTSQTPLLADTLMPSESGLIPVRLQNVGNRDAAYNLVTTFSEDGWNAVVEDETGVSVPNPIVLGKAEVTNLFLNVTADSLATPGVVSFNLRATCPSCGTSLFGADILGRNIEVPILRQASITADQNTYQSAADGVPETVYMSLFNLGNDDEQYALSLGGPHQYILGAQLAGETTAILDAWDGETTLILTLPMPVGLSPAPYYVDVTATNVDDSSVSATYRINVEILDTAAVGVSDESSDQSFLPGSMDTTDRSFEITNYGNSEDRFTITLDIPEGMVAELIDPVPIGGVATTPVIQTGESWEAKVRFRFLTGADGSRTLGLTATSVNDPTISDTGEATYLVGRQGTIDLTPPAAIPIDEPNLIYTMDIEVKNKLNPLVYPSQTISMDKVDGEWSSYISVRIDNNDRSFSLESDMSRIVTVEVQVGEATLINLPSDTLTVNFTVYATSLTVADSPTAKLTVVLQKQSADAGDGDDASSEDDGQLVRNIVLWSGFLIVVGVLGFITFKILTTIDKEDELDDWDDMMYQDSLTATYGAVAAAPTVPMSAPPSPEPTAVPDAAPPAAPAPATGPPLPPEGLPDGWTMDQWEHYGQQYLDGQL